MPHNYTDTTLHAADYPGLVAQQERDVTPRRVWIPDNGSDVYTGEEWAALNALARELGWWELGGSK